MDLISIRKEITITFLSRQKACAVAKDNKCGSCSDDSVLHDMIIDSVKAYKCEIEKAEKKEDNLTGLSAFRDRMINEGNPSSSVLEKVFGKEGAADFFRSCVMPMDDTGKD